MKKYFWAPHVHWRHEDNQIIINDFQFRGKVVDLFPDIYFQFQKGISLSEIYDVFGDFNQKILKMFLKDLIHNRVLVSNVITPKELFETQYKFAYQEYDEDYFLYEENIKSYKNKQLTRFMSNKALQSISLEEDSDIPPLIKKRKSIRDFDTSKKMDFSKFSKLLNVFKQSQIEEGIKYFYPSAGGLYPVNIYLYIKDGRIENIEEGVYLYNPHSHSINLISRVKLAEKKYHYFINHNAFNTSNFSIFFTLDCDVIMPKYKGDGYYYGILECGVMTATLANFAEYLDIGACSIGDIDFEKIKDEFNLNSNEIYLHSVEVGLKNKGV
ncbi:SagB/ThcOx family dehydrogenase [Bacillus amyloliquefaciens]|uniref:SagB/ThcOx family dehydrogenase n=1 Tax=Bacillus amyloliquefaciens TaxID=1390 RepID=UPI000828265E|nr:SagB/ThcOx family dehydrogenase [Bacillus amyloliquefaciens]OCB97260.1 hypothetical protein SRCM101294_01043 [Bacillus amyloliquefaciens]QOQ54191.1 SagB/ThcOx family dehydrogenase [Bacillus amyloliquefaciens]